MSNVLLLESEKDREEREEALPFFLCFWLVTRVKTTSSTFGASTVISISGEEVGIEIGP